MSKPLTDEDIEYLRKLCKADNQLYEQRFMRRVLATIDRLKAEVEETLKAARLARDYFESEVADDESLLEEGSAVREPLLALRVSAMHRAES